MTKEEKITFILDAIQTDAKLLSLIKARMGVVIPMLDDVVINNLYAILNQG